METKNFSGLVVSNEPQANKKFFGAAVFQKCCRGVGEQPTFSKQIELHNEMKQKSKRKSQELQLPLKSEGCNKSQGFRGNCDSQSKLGMCPSLAEPHASDFPRNSVSCETLLLEKTIFNIRQKRVPPLLLPTSILQLPRCLARTCNFDSHNTTLFELDSFKKCNCSRKNISANLICFANVGCSPTPRQHF